MSKFCSNCGAQLEDNAGFCGACGSKQEVAAAPAPAPTPAPAQQPVQQPAPAQTQIPAPQAATGGDGSPIGAVSEKVASMSPEQKKKIGIIAAVAAAAIVLVVVIVVVITAITKYQKIDCTELYYVSYSGINGQATASVYLATKDNIRYNDYSLEDKYRESSFYDGEYDYDDYNDYVDSLVSKWLSTDTKDMKKAWTKFDSKSDMKKAQDKLIDAIEFKIDEDDLKNLSNGDTIKVKVKYNEEKLKKRNIKLTNTEFTITVEGLLEPEVLDPMSKIKVEFSGVDGRGRCDIDTTGLNDIEYYVFYVSYSTVSGSGNGYYENGDVIEVEAYPSYSLYNGYFTYDGKYYTYDEAALKKEFTVDGLTGLEVVDPFDGLTIDYTGIAPDLRAEVNTEGCKSAVQECISYDIDVSRGLSIGDTITVTAYVNWWYEDEFIEYGYKLASDEVTKTFTVDDNVPHYINDINEATVIDTEALFEKQLDDVRSSTGMYLGTSYVAKGTTRIVSVTSVTDDIAYLVAPSDTATSSNKYYQLFKVQADCTVGDTHKNNTYYVLAIADSAYVDEDGNLAFTDTWVSTYASDDKQELIDKHILTDSNQSDDKVITSTALAPAAAPEPTEEGADAEEETDDGSSETDEADADDDSEAA